MWLLIAVRGGASRLRTFPVDGEHLPYTTGFGPVLPVL